MFRMLLPNILQLFGFLLAIIGIYMLLGLAVALVVGGLVLIGTGILMELPGKSE